MMGREMDDFVRGWVKVLEDDIALLERAARREEERAMRAIYILRAAMLKRAINRFILGSAFYAASIRANNHFRK